MLECIDRFPDTIGRMIFSACQSENRISLENRRETLEASVARVKRSLPVIYVPKVTIEDRAFS